MRGVRRVLVAVLSLFPALLRAGESPVPTEALLLVTNTAGTHRSNTSATPDHMATASARAFKLLD